MAERWITWKGKHILVDDDGNIIKKPKKITKKDIVEGDIYQGADGYWNYDLKEGIESDYGLPNIWNKTKSGANYELKLIVQRENIINEKKDKNN